MWGVTISETAIQLEYVALNTWEVRIPKDTACYKHWRLVDGPCANTGAYSAHDCADGDCTDTNSCEDSAGATCVVSAS